MKHKGTEKLETIRLILRKIKLDDSLDMYNNWATNPNVTKHMTWSPHENIEITRMVINSWVEQYQNLDFYQWAIELKETSEVIGSITIVKVFEHIKECEIGYCIGEKWWNQGIMSEALKKVIEFLFTKVEANRISACHDVDNPASGKVMMKAGMKFEGIFRQKGITSTGKITDLAYYSILRKEYDI